jgi:hypothetical protein
MASGLRRDTHRMHVCVQCLPSNLSWSLEEWSNVNVVSHVGEPTRDHLGSTIVTILRVGECVCIKGVP